MIPILIYTRTVFPGFFFELSKSNFSILLCFLKRKVYENKGNDRQRKTGFTHFFLQTKIIRKCMKISQKNLYIDMGIKGHTKPSFSLSLLVKETLPNCYSSKKS